MIVSLPDVGETKEVPTSSFGQGGATPRKLDGLPIAQVTVAGGRYARLRSVQRPPGRMHGADQISFHSSVCSPMPLAAGVRSFHARASWASVAPAPPVPRARSLPPGLQHGVSSLGRASCAALSTSRAPWVPETSITAPAVTEGRSMLQYIPVILVSPTGTRSRWKMRSTAAGLHLFDRTSGLNLLLDEVSHPTSQWAKAPRYVSIALTNACDLSCAYCYAPKRPAALNADIVTRGLMSSIATVVSESVLEEASRRFFLGSLNSVALLLTAPLSP